MQPLSFYPGEDESQLKESFVRYKARLPLASDFEVAEKVFEGRPHSAQRSAQAAILWGKDLDVQSEVVELRRKGDVDEPTISREQLTTEILALARNEHLVPIKERLDAYKLAAHINGFIERSGTQVNVQVNRVMQIKDHGDNDAWEQQARIQQQRLASN